MMLDEERKQDTVPSFKSGLKTSIKSLYNVGSCDRTNIYKEI